MAESLQQARRLQDTQLLCWQHLKEKNISNLFQSLLRCTTLISNFPMIIIVGLARVYCSLFGLDVFCIGCSCVHDHDDDSPSLLLETIRFNSWSWSISGDMIHFNNYHHIAPGLEIDQTAIIETKVLQALGDGTVVSSIHLTPARRCYIISLYLLYFILLAFAVFYISCIW